MINQWLSDKTNRKILFVEKVQEANRIIRRYNKLGHVVANLSVLHIQDAAKQIVLQDLAKNKANAAFELYDNEICELIVEGLLREHVGEHFVPENSISIDSAKETLRVMNVVRTGVATQEIIQKQVEESLQCRYEQLCVLIQQYEAVLASNGAYDNVLLLQKACELLENDANAAILFQNTKFGCLIPAEYSYLENRFMELVSDGTCEMISYIEENQDAVKYSFFRGYGLANEIQFVANDIWENKLPFGKVNLLYVSPEQESFIQNVLSKNNISYRMVSGYDAASEKYIYLMKELLHWIEGGCRKKIDELLKNSGCLRFDIDEDSSKKDDGSADNGSEAARERRKRYQRNLDAAVEELKGIVAGVQKDAEINGEINVAVLFDQLVQFQKKYTKKSNLAWAKAKPIYVRKAKKIAYISGVTSLEDAALVLLREFEDLRITEAEDENAVTVSRIQERQVLEREYNYIIGLSARLFQQAVQQSPVMEDAGIEKCVDVSKGFVAFAAKDNELRKQYLLDTLLSLSQGEIKLGYSYYDTLGMRECSPSVFYTDLLRKHTGSNDVEVLPSYVYDLLDYQHVDTAILFKENEENDPQGHDTNNENKADEKDDKTISGEEFDKLSPDEQNEMLEDGFKVDYEDDGDGFGKEKKDTDKADAAVEDCVTENTENSMEANSDEDEDEQPLVIRKQLSPTSVGVILNCPRSYYYKHVRYIPEKEKEEVEITTWLNPLERGNLVHKILQTYCEEVLKDNHHVNKDLDQVKFEEVFKQCVDEKLAEFPYKSQETFEMQKDDIYNGTKNYLVNLHEELSNPNNKWVVERCEGNIMEYSKNNMHRIQDCLEIIYDGYIDRMDSYVEDGIKHIRIIDYKSGKGSNKEAEIKSNLVVQHAVYSHAVKKDASIQVDEFIYDFPLDSEMPRIILKDDELDYNPTAEQIMYDVVYNEEYDKKGRICFTGDYSDAKLCKYCEYRDICIEVVEDKNDY